MKENCKHEYLNERYFKCALCGELIEEEKLNNLGVARNAVLADGWRETSKILPDNRDDVIVGNSNNKCVSVGWYNADNSTGGKWIVRTVHFDGEVTHWQPLPLPPTVSQRSRCTRSLPLILYRE